MSSDWQPARTPLFGIALVPPASSLSMPCPKPLAQSPAAPAGTLALIPPAAPPPSPAPAASAPGAALPQAPADADARRAMPALSSNAVPATPLRQAPAPGASPAPGDHPAQTPAGGAPSALLREEAVASPTSMSSSSAPGSPEAPTASPAQSPPAPFRSSSQSAGWTAVAVSSSTPVFIAVVAENDPDLWPAKWLHPAERRLLAQIPPASRRHALQLLTAARRALTQALSFPEPAAASIDLSPMLEGVQSMRLGDWTVQRVPAPAGCCVAVAAPGSGWGYSLLPQHAFPESTR